MLQVGTRGQIRTSPTYAVPTRWRRIPAADILPLASAAVDRSISLFVSSPRTSTQQASTDPTSGVTRNAPKRLSHTEQTTLQLRYGQ
jgi:hypothetical protein